MKKAIRLYVATYAATAGTMMLAAPAAHANSAAAEYFTNRADRSAVPQLLSQDERAFYKSLFTAIRQRNWAQVQTLFAQKPDGPLHEVARAEYYLAPGSPKVDPAGLSQWLAGGTSLPEAGQISSLAAKRGVTALPALPQTNAFATLPAQPRRTLPRPAADGTMPAGVANAILARIKADDPAGARQILAGSDASLSPQARAEWRQRVAWSFYIGNDDISAYAMALSAARGGPSLGAAPANGTDGSFLHASAPASGPAPGFATNAAASDATSAPAPSAPQNPGIVSGPWTAEAWWTSGLAAWRMNDYAAAGTSFETAARTTANPELAAAACYWQSRADVRSRRPEQAAASLLRAAAYGETMYGMLAAEQLGLKPPSTRSAPDFTVADWQLLRDNGNVRAAVELAEIGEDGLADTVLRHQARIGQPALYQPLSRLARDLGLSATQLWMAYNVPAGGMPALASRYPTPKWTPANGWQIDPALVLAHSLQESQFRTNVVSPAGARGLMQIMPATARQHAGKIGVTGSAGDLDHPDINLALGQIHLESLRDSAATQGLLLKVVAAYNAGLLPLSRWNSMIRADGDPLLWMESVPYWETRSYVATVIRNYWMYEGQAGGASSSRTALAQDMWPTFPDLTGSRAVRIATSGAVIPQPDRERLASGY